MPVIEHKVMINRPVTDVFRFVTDFSNSPKWQPSGVSLERAGKVRIGDMIVGQQRIMGRMQHVNADVVDFSPNQKLVFSGIMGGYAFRTTYTFNFSGTGGTEVAITTDIRIPWFYFLFRPFVLSGLNSQTAAALQNLKQFMEDRRDLGT
jgi:uncharacterized protein YndB with AHSA1/START domain